MRIFSRATELLSGTVYTARDAAHKRIMSLMKTGALPFDLNGAAYYAAPPYKDDGQIGSFAPPPHQEWIVCLMLDTGLPP